MDHGVVEVPLCHLLWPQQESESQSTQKRHLPRNKRLPLPTEIHTAPKHVQKLSFYLNKQPLTNHSDRNNLSCSQSWSFFWVQEPQTSYPSSWFWALRCTGCVAGGQVVGNWGRPGRYNPSWIVQPEGQQSSTVRVHRSKLYGRTFKHGQSTQQGRQVGWRGPGGAKGTWTWKKNDREYTFC